MFFLKKSYTKCGGKSNPIPFYEILRLSISQDEQSEMLKMSFYCMFKSKSSEIY